jgi:hypothetical protein
MSASVVRRLVLKDLYMSRWLIGGTIVSGLGSLYVCTLSKVGFSFGSVTFISTLIVLSVLIAMLGVFQERKDRSYLFILGLPLSGRDYIAAKLAGSLVCFLIPWIVLTLGTVAACSTSSVLPRGMTPFAFLLCVYSLLDACVLIAAALTIRSEGIIAGCIVVTNVLVSFFLFTVASLPSIKDNMGGRTAVWDGTFFTVLALEILVICVAVVLPLRMYSRRCDFV